MSETLQLPLAAVAGIAVLLALVIWLKLHAFLALMIASLLIGLAAGMSPEKVLSSMEQGMGSTLGFVAIVVGLGSMLGGMLEISGGAQTLARNLLRWFGVERSAWALGLAGFLISIPVFFDVGFVILIPVLYGLTQETKKSLVGFAVPLMAGMATTHAFIPPTPGPTLVAHELGASLGYVVLFGAIVGLPAMIIAGPIFGKWIASRVEASPAALLEVSEEEEDGRPPPSFGLVAGLIGLPLALMVLGAVAPKGDAAIWTVVRTLGNPFIALLITVLLCFRFLGTKRGLTREDVQTLATKSLEPAGIIILVTGAGGLLKQVLVDSKVGDAIASLLHETSLPLILIAFVFAAALRIMQGSATVAMVGAAAFVSPLLAGTDPSESTKALLVIAIASGGTFLSHVNDAGFWLVSRYLGLNVADTLKSWTLMTVLIGTVGLILSLILAAVL